MAPWTGFVGPSYVSQSPIADCEQCINWYPEIVESTGAKSRFALYPTPGFKDFAVSTLSPNRGMFAQNGRAFAVIGFGFFEMFADQTLIQRGTVEADGSPATICSNGDVSSELFVTSGGKGYVYDLVGNVLSDAIADLVANQGAYLDGFFIALDTVSSVLRISNFGDGATWDPLQFRVRQLASDRWIGMVLSHSEIWLFGTESYEVWVNQGTAPFPFGPIPGAFYTQGCGAGFAITAFAESVAWLSRSAQGDGIVMMASQYAPQRISNHALENAIQGYLRDGHIISDAISFGYQQNGHAFFVLTFPSAEMTWVYDVTTSMWHRRAFWDVSPQQQAQFTAWRPLYHCYAFGQHIVGDRETGRILSMDITFPLDAGGAVIRRVRVAPHLFNEKKQMFFSNVELDMQPGIGNTVDPGSDPQVMFRISRDGGRTYGNERTTGVGKIGEYKRRVQFNRLGRARDFVGEFSVSDPVVPWALINAYIEASAGAS